MSGMVELYGKVGGNIVAVGECDPDLAHKYGIVGKGETLDGGFRITQMVEKPAKGTAPSNYFINGRYILQPEIFESWRFRSAVPAMKSRSRMRC
jgi:UTP--glucose-1-phosphate uridylyltransferase